MINSNASLYMYIFIFEAHLQSVVFGNCSDGVWCYTGGVENSCVASLVAFTGTRVYIIII